MTRAAPRASSASIARPAPSVRRWPGSSWSGPAASTRRACSSTRRRQRTERPGQWLGRDRPLPVRADPLPHPRLAARPGRRRDAQRSRHRRRAHLPAAVQSSRRPPPRLPARLRHAVLEHRASDTGRAQRQRPHPGLRRRAEAGDQARPAWFEMHPRWAKCCPTPDITVGDAGQDRYGVPIVKIDYRIGDNERKMAEHMADTAEAIARPPVPSWSTTSAPTSIATARRSTSTALPHGRRSEALGAERLQPDAQVPNVYVVDEIGPFPTATEKNRRHDSGPVVACDRSPGRTAEARRLRAVIMKSKVCPSSSSAAVPPAAWPRGT